MFIRRALLIINAFFLTASCGQNPLAELASKDSAEALFESMQIYADASEFDKAYTVALEMTAKHQGFTTTDAYRKVYAGVLAGQCGYTFTSFTTNMGTATGDNFFELLKNTFNTVTVDPDKCIAALAEFRQLSNPSSTDSLNSLILNLASIGVTLKASSVAPGLNTCALTGANGISTTRMKNLVASFGSIISNIADITSAISGGVSGLDDLDALCNPAVPNDLSTALAPICSANDPSAVTAVSAATFRRLLADTDMGLGACDFDADLILASGNLAGAYTCCNNLAPVAVTGHTNRTGAGTDQDN